MSAESYIRAQPCTNCGEPLVVIDLYSDGVQTGRAVQRPPVNTTVQHIGFRRGLGHPADTIDDECARSSR